MNYNPVRMRMGVRIPGKSLIGRGAATLPIWKILIPFEFRLVSCQWAHIYGPLFNKTTDPKCTVLETIPYGPLLYLNFLLEHLSQNISNRCSLSRLKWPYDHYSSSLFYHFISCTVKDNNVIMSWGYLKLLLLQYYQNKSKPN